MANKPWKSKANISKMCEAIGAEFKPDRIKDPDGNRVFIVYFRGESIGFKNLSHVYIWALQNTKPSKRP